MAGAQPRDSGGRSAHRPTAILPCDIRHVLKCREDAASERGIFLPRKRLPALKIGGQSFSFDLLCQLSWLDLSLPVALWPTGGLRSGAFCLIISAYTQLQFQWRWILALNQVLPNMTASSP